MTTPLPEQSPLSADELAELDALLAANGSLTRDEAATLLHEALEIVRTPRRNSRGGLMQMAGVHGRLMAVLGFFCSRSLSAIEGDAIAKATRLRDGFPLRWNLLPENPPQHDGWVLLRHACPCCPYITVSIARLARNPDGSDTWLSKGHAEVSSIDDELYVPITGYVQAWTPIIEPFDSHLTPTQH